MSIQIKAFAKINLSLNITGAYEHMHTLDMIVTSVDIADVIVLERRADSRINIQYVFPSDNCGTCSSRGSTACDPPRPNIPVGTDSVSKAVVAFQDIYGKMGLDIVVEKHIPIAAGLGGSGVDAAGLLRALAKLYEAEVGACELHAMAQSVGSDVPYLLRGGFCRVTGTGDETAFFDSDTEFNLVVAKGQGGVLSKEAYQVFDTLYPSKNHCPSDNDALVAALAAGVAQSWIRPNLFSHMQNALTKPSITLNPHIATTLTALAQEGAIHALMTGSGAACVGFFPDLITAQAVAQRLQQKGLYAKAVKTLRSGVSIG